MPINRSSGEYLSSAGSFPSSCRMPDLWAPDRETLRLMLPESPFFQVWDESFP